MNICSKLVLTAGVFAALTFTVSCSDDDKGGSSGGPEKWCVIPWNEDETKCGKIGAELSSVPVTLTEQMCNDNYDDSSIEDKKPDGCEVITK